ncbi:unnamed protein product [Wuchereria bancrofti]|uniref:Uncharacterized protein n=1 Tax=Wuchereria bancrofti TaxID=6293 RepID=A0A3P7GNN0_WUCBA|nr:unnamed protein product [Wuchereria bancrofti]
MELEKDLLFPGFIASFLLENKCPAGENIDTENILNWIGKVEERLKDDPEYFRLYLNVTELYHRLDFNEEASVCANLAIKYWPAHIFEGRLEQLVRNAVVLEALMEAEKKLRISEMEKELEERLYKDPKASGSVNEMLGKELMSNDVSELSSSNNDKISGYATFDYSSQS